MTSPTYDKALGFTLGQEGGRVDDPKDPGGRTNEGVTQRTYDAWRHKNGLPLRSVYLVTSSEVRSIYLAIWNHIDGDKLPPGVAIMAFDIATNMGPGRITPWLSQTATLGPKDRIKRLDALRCGFWRHLRIFRVFGVGWMRRETACLKLSVAQ